MAFKKGTRKKTVQKPASVANTHGESPEDIASFVEKTASRFTFAAPQFNSSEEKPGKAELQDLLVVLKQMHQKLSTLHGASTSSLERFEADRASAGLSAEPDNVSGFASMRVQILLSYIICLIYYLKLKVRGIRVSDHPVVARLHWLRSLLEKLKPVDQRLQYQIGKLLQWKEARGPSGDGTKEAHQLRPGELSAGVEDEDGAEAPEDEADDGGIYKPPKIAQMEYTGDHMSIQERAERDLERNKARLERSEVMRSLREEFTDAPAEIHGSLKSDKAEKAARLEREKAFYEEDNMLRVRTSKKDAKIRGRLLREGRTTGAGVATLNDMTADFNELSKSSRKGRNGRGGTAMDNYQASMKRVRETRGAVSNALESVTGGLGGGGGGRGKEGKRARR